MTAEIIILATALVFLVMSIFLFCGKGSWLVAGYNTASEEEKKKYDVKRVCRASGVICLVSACMLCAMAYFGYKVDTGAMSENAMLPFGVVFACVVLTTVFVAIRYIKKK